MTFAAFGGTDEPVRPPDGAPPAPLSTGGGRRPAVRTALAVIVALVVGVTTGVVVGRSTVTETPVVVADAGTTTQQSPNVPQPSPTLSTVPPTSVPLLPALPASDGELAPPVEITIPRLDIEQGIIELGVTAERKLEVPQNGTDIGWWRSGPVPGEAGSAVLAGHVNWNGGQPAVFSDLGTLVVGDEVFVTRDDDSVATYQVTDTKMYPKDDFPNALIYRLDGEPKLTLITCGGDFVGSHYVDNLVVFADLVGDTRLDPAA